MEPGGPSTNVEVFAASGACAPAGAAPPAPARCSAAPDVVAVLRHHAVIGSCVALPWLVAVASLGPAGPAPVAVLLVVVAVVLPPVAVVAVRRRLRTEDLLGFRGGRVRSRLGLDRPSRRELLGAGLPAVLAALVLPGAGLPVEAALQRSDWLARWPSTGLDLTGVAGGGHGPGSPGGPVLLASWVVVAVVVGPVLEEVVFRGLLQPLVPGGAWGRVVGGSALFAVYHLWQPASWVTVFLATLPVAWVRERTGSTWLAAGVHVVVNAAALTLLLVGAMSR